MKISFVVPAYSGAPAPTPTESKLTALTGVGNGTAPSAFDRPEYAGYMAEDAHDGYGRSQSADLDRRYTAAVLERLGCSDYGKDIFRQKHMPGAAMLIAGCAVVSVPAAMSYPEERAGLELAIARYTKYGKYSGMHNQPMLRACFGLQAAWTHFNGLKNAMENLLERLCPENKDLLSPRMTLQPLIDQMVNERAAGVDASRQEEARAQLHRYLDASQSLLDHAEQAYKGAERCSVVVGEVSSCFARDDFDVAFSSHAESPRVP